jgi:exodeoxyribonuclease VII small subunit
MAKKKAARTKSSDQSEPSTGDIDFESALKEVENVVARLEGGELGLTESLAEYERGIEKIKRCHQLLQHAERRISVLTQVDEDGTPTVEPVEMGGQNKGDRTGDRPAGKKQSKKADKGQSDAFGDVDEPKGLF